MNISVEDISSVQKRLKIEVPANRVDEEIERVTGEFQKVARIQGFRPGKAPRGMVNKRYEKEIDDEVKRQLVPSVVREAVQSKNLKIVSQPKVEDLKFERGLSMSFSTLIELEPEFPIPDYKKLQLSKLDDAITDEEVTDVTNRLLDQYADYKDIEGRPVQQDDFAVISYKGTVEGKPIVELAPDAKTLSEQNGFWLWIKEDIFLPGFGEQLVGANQGETKTVTVTFPEEFGVDALKQKEASFEVTIDSIKEKILPELTDEFCEKTFSQKKDEWLDRLRSNITDEKGRSNRRQHMKEIFDQLNDAANFELPDSTVKAETQRMVHDIVRENQMRGITDDMLNEKKDDIFNAAEDSAKDKVKVSFILGRIAEQEKIEVASEDFAMEVQKIAIQSKSTPEKVAKQLQENGGIHVLAEEILNRKTMEFILNSLKSE